MANIIEFLIGERIANVMNKKLPANHGYICEVSKDTSKHTDTLYFHVRVQKGKQQMDFHVDSFPLVDLEKVLDAVGTLIKACIAVIEGKYD